MLPGNPCAQGRQGYALFKEITLARAASCTAESPSDNVRRLALGGARHDLAFE